MKPRWKEIELEHPWLQAEYHDFDADKEMVEKYKINNILPVFVFLDKTENEFLRLNGEIEKKKLVEIINQYKDA